MFYENIFYFTKDSGSGDRTGVLNNRPEIYVCIKWGKLWIRQKFLILGSDYELAHFSLTQKPVHFQDWGHRSTEFLFFWTVIDYPSWESDRAN